MPWYGWIILIGAIVFAFWWIHRIRKKRGQDNAPVARTPISSLDGQRMDLRRYFLYEYPTPKGSAVWSPKLLDEGYRTWLFQLLDEGVDEFFDSVRGDVTEEGRPFDESTMIHTHTTRATQKVYALIDEVFIAPASGVPSLTVFGGLSGMSPQLTAGTVIGGGGWFGDWHPFRLIALPLYDRVQVTSSNLEQYVRNSVRHEWGDHSWTEDHDPHYHRRMALIEIHPFFPKAGRLLVNFVKTVVAKATGAHSCCVPSGASPKVRIEDITLPQQGE